MPDEAQHPSIGPEHVLGELEAAVMQVIWGRGEMTVRAVQEALRPTRQPAYTTVMTVMSRLAQKGVLLIRKQGKSYYYRPAQATPNAFTEHRVQRAVEDLVDVYGDVAIAQFLRALDTVDPERLAALRALARNEEQDET